MSRRDVRREAQALNEQAMREVRYQQDMQLQRELARQALSSKPQLRLTHVLGSTGTAFGGITKSMLHSRPGTTVFQEVKPKDPWGAMPLHMQLIRSLTLGLLIGLTLAIIGLLIL